jgi:hypothetical protein
MGSGRLDEPFFSYEERRQVVAISLHSFRSRVLFGRRSPGNERQRRVSLNFVVVRVFVRVDQAAARRNAAAFALDATGSFERSLSRIAHLRTSPPTAACNSGPGTTENYVEARAAASLSRPHRSLLSRSRGSSVQDVLPTGRPLRVLARSPPVTCGPPPKARAWGQRQRRCGYAESGLAALSRT